MVISCAAPATKQRRPPPRPARRSRCRRASQCGPAGHGWLGGCVPGCHHIPLADVTDLSPTRLPGSPEHQHRRHPAGRKGRGRYRLKDCGHSQRVRHRANAFRIAGPDLDPLTGCAAMRSRAVPVKRLPCPDLEGPGPASASRTQPAAPRLTRPHQRIIRVSPPGCSERSPEPLARGFSPYITQVARRLRAVSAITTRRYPSKHGHQGGIVGPGQLLRVALCPQAAR